jgi:hypothetical protein
MLGLLLGAAVIADSAVVRRGLTEILNATRDLHVVSSGPLTSVSTLEREGVDLLVEDIPDRASAELVLSRAAGQPPALALVAEPEHARARPRGLPGCDCP